MSGNLTAKISNKAILEGRLLLRHVALDVLSSIYVNKTRILNDSPRVHLLYLHHVFKGEIQGFQKLLEWLTAEEYVFVSHSEAVDRIAQQDCNGRYVSISFDDGLESCIDASRIMDEYGAKGCFYVNGAIVGETDSSKIDHFCRNRLNMAPMQFMDWNDLEDLVKRGHEIGNHTFSHLDCGKLDLDMFCMEFQRNHELIEGMIGAPRHFAWPYGRAENIKQEQLTYVRDAGYKSAASAIRGCHIKNRNEDQFYLLREHLMADWPLNHIKYFMGRSIAVCS